MAPARETAVSLQNRCGISLRNRHGISLRIRHGVRMLPAEFSIKTRRDAGPVAHVIDGKDRQAGAFQGIRHQILAVA